MKKVIVVCVAVLLVMGLSVTAFAESLGFPTWCTEGTYGTEYAAVLRIAKIEDVKGDSCIVTARDGKFSYVWYAYDGDWEIGDYAACIMYDNDSSNIKDDIVIAAKYVG